MITPTFERVPTNNGDYSEWEEATGATTETTPKQNESGYWERAMDAFSRSTSWDSQRSRTSSMGGRPRDNVDSSISRESGASLTSGKTDRRDICVPTEPANATNVEFVLSLRIPFASILHERRRFPVPCIPHQRSSEVLGSYHIKHLIHVSSPSSTCCKLLP